MNPPDDNRRPRLRPTKRSAASSAASKKRTPNRRYPYSYCVHDSDKDMMFIISGESGEERRVVRKPRRAEEAAVAIAQDSGWGSTMPVEILHIIFKVLADSEGAVPILCRLSQVCRRWNQVAAAPALWQRVSVSRCWDLPEKSTPPRLQSRIQDTMQVMMSRRFSMVSEFSLHHWRLHVPFILQSLAAHCRLLTALTLSNCERVTTGDLLSVASCCPQLQALSLQQCVSGACPELRDLEINTIIPLHSIDVFQFPIESLQSSCPKLEVLRLLNLLWSSHPDPRKPVHPVGFQDLQEICLATSTSSRITDSICRRLLRDSTRLRVLDVRGCSLLTAAGLAQLPCADLRCLYFGLYRHTPYMTGSSAEFGSYLMTGKWRHSLQELDLTAQTFSEEDLAQALALLCKDGANDTLRSLTLTGTRVSAHSVRHLLSRCQALTYLNLSSCRNILRGRKRAYRSAEEIRECLSALESGQQDEAGE